VTISRKLASIVAGLVASFAISIAAYSAILRPVSLMEAERASVTALGEAVRDRAIAANGLITASSFEEAAAGDAASALALEGAFAAVKSLKTLPRINDEVRASLAAIEQLGGLIGGDEESIAARSAEILEAMKARGSEASQLFAVAADVGIDPLDSLLRFKARSLANDVSNMSFALVMAAGAIGRQYESIEAEIGKIRAASTAAAIAIVAAVLGLAVYVCLRIGAGIARRIRRIEAGIKAMRDGDLTAAAAVPGSDEIGELSRNLASLGERLRDSIAKVQSASAESLAMKGTLVAAAQEALASAELIGASEAEIGRKIAMLDDSLGSATADIESIGGSIAGQDERIRDQLSMAEESTASIAQIMASINNVAAISEERKSSIDRLVGAVAGACEMMEENFTEVRSIGESVESIMEITEIIEGISSMTDLLAMNAAIEAAHAGDQGRGFSVVADEIRKLAEASSENSKGIGGILGEIAGRADSASRTGDAADRAFKAIRAEVVALRDSFAEIFGSMAEIRSGSDQILRAMGDLREASSVISGESSKIGGSSSRIGRNMSTLKEISAGVATGMSDIARGNRGISEAMREVLSRADRLGGIGDELDSGLEEFRTSLS